MVGYGGADASPIASRGLAGRVPLGRGKTARSKDLRPNFADPRMAKVAEAHHRRFFPAQSCPRMLFASEVRLVEKEGSEARERRRSRRQGRQFWRGAQSVSAVVRRRRRDFDRSRKLDAHIVRRSDSEARPDAGCNTSREHACSAQRESYLEQFCLRRASETKAAANAPAAASLIATRQTAFAS